MEDRRRKSEGGSSLLEVLIAMAVLLFLMIGVLSMFSMAYLQNLGSAARTDMTYKAQQVADVIHLLNYMQRTQQALPASTDTGLTFPLASGTSVNITATSGSALKYAYWGSPTAALPNAAGIVDPANLRYLIQVSVTGPTNGLMTVTVSVVPNSSASNITGARYLGNKIRWKEVDYAIQIPA
ncbi:MAG: prepilin-type N-terminal cleavage/methylation domain-containing protein [Acidobacteriota bacterium]